jgi:hypothetical protein
MKRCKTPIIFSKGVYNMAIKVFNGLPDTLKINSSDPKTFKGNLKDILYMNSFYTMEELFSRWMFSI